MKFDLRNWFKRLMKLQLLTLFILSTGLVACKKDSKTQENTNQNTTNTSQSVGNLILVFHAEVDTVLLAFGKKYLNTNGDTFTVSKFNYFTSNVVLFNADKTTFTESNSYHLVKHNQGPLNAYTINNVPVGTYTSICFYIGVDSTRNVSGSQTGDLDPGNDMYWGWTSGYIFFKLEGSAPKSGSSGKQFEYHIGGYAGANKTQRLVVLNFASTPSVVKENSYSEIHLKVNVNEIFSAPNKIDFKTLYNISNAGSNAKIIADNYADMITFDTVLNK